MKIRLLTLIALFLIGTSEIKPVSVVVIGGGPTGLAAAIEARLSGADVVVVEKRESYVRQNTLFLYRVTVDLFDKWNVDVLRMERLYLKGERRGFVLIKDLEESLAKRVDDLGITRLRGEFKDFADEEQAALIHTADGSLSLPYDILVGADGAHSRVREKLGIPCSRIGEAIGGVAMIPGVNAENTIGIENREHRDVFVKKVTIPFASVFFVQNHPDKQFETISQKQVAQFAREAGWLEEAKMIEEGGLLNLENVHIYFQRAAVFSNPQRSAILLGDAAGCTTFYVGSGVNFSLKTAELAGAFFQHFHEDSAYSSFDLDMEKEVDTLIQNGRHLFAGYSVSAS